VGEVEGTLEVCPGGSCGDRFSSDVIASVDEHVSLSEQGQCGGHGTGIREGDGEPKKRRGVGVLLLRGSIHTL
jgi:hypothetical protein